MSQAELIDLLVQALPLIEDAATFDDYDAYGKAKYTKLARDVRKAIGQADGTRADDVPVPVVFRIWPAKQGGDVIALFPTLPGDNKVGSVSSYQHVGQHGPADYTHVIAATRPATPEEYAPLARELAQVGYLLRVRRRARVTA
jgi:hypothetical protein